MFKEKSSPGRRSVALLLAFLTLFTLLSGLSAFAASDGQLLDPENTDALKNAVIGVETGSTLGQIAEERFPEAEILYFNTIPDLPKALDSGKIDAYLIDEPMFRLCQKEYPRQYVLGRFSEEQSGFVFPKESEKTALLLSQVNEFLAEFREEGGLEELDDIWFGEDENKKVVHYEALTGENGTLKLATNDQTSPFAYHSGDQIVGLDIDLTVRFCEKYGYALEIVNYDFAGLLAAVSVGKADLGVNAITITEERKESLAFSDPYYTGGTVAVACHADAAETDKATEVDPAAYDGKAIGVQTGTIIDQVLLEKFPGAEMVYYDSMTDLAAALDAGKIEAFACESASARLMVRQYATQTIRARLTDQPCAYAFPMNAEKSPTLLAQMNEFLAEIETNGVKKDIEDIWFGDDESRMVVDYQSLPNVNGKLCMATSSTIGIPFTFIKDGKNVGYDIDMAARFCEKYGYALEIVDSNFAGVISAIQSGKCDFAGSCLSVTEERKDSMLFSDTNYLAGISLVVKKEGAPRDPAERKAFFAGIAESFEKTFIREDRWKLFAAGLGTTVLITLLSAVFGTVLGFGVYLLYRKGYRPFNILIDVLSDILEKTPVVVILMILYYILFGKSNISGIWVSIIGFSLLFMVSVIGLIKMGVGAVDKGQMEAALAIGYTDNRAFLRVILPQAALHFLPGLRGELVSLIKSTAVVGYIAVQDLTKIGDIVRSRTYEAFFPLIASAVIYFAAAWLLTLLVKRIAFRIDPEKRSREKILKGVTTK